MKVTLYKYIGDSDTANKLLRDCTVIYDKEVIPYGAFNPNGASFRLDTLHDVNYAKFTYNSHDYYGYVDVKTDSKGIYNYTITTDPLTTAWYAGCFNVGNICKYSDYGTLLVTDDRATHNGGYSWITKSWNNNDIVQPSEDDWYFLTVLTPQPLVQNWTTNNPLFTTYMMKYKVYAEFVRLFLLAKDEDQKKYAPSIVGIYITKAYETIDVSSFLAATDNKIQLWAIMQGERLSTLVPMNLQISRTVGTVYRYDLTYEDQSLWKIYGRHDITLDEPITVSSLNLETQFQLHVPDCGDIRFSLPAVTPHQSTPYVIKSIGYAKQYDFVSGSVKAYLVINGVDGYPNANVHKEFTVQGTLPIKAPFIYDGSVTDWQYENSLLKASKASSTLKVASAALSAGASAASGNPLGIFLAAQAVGQTTTQDLTAGARFQHLQWQQANETWSNVGGAGGSSDYAQKPWVCAWCHLPHNLADIQHKFGKPDGLVRVVGNMTGWVQTEACHLPSNGLPFDIVTQAEQLANQGFRIVV